MGVALGSLLRAVGGRGGAFIVVAIAIVAAIPVWMATRNPYFLLPFAGVVVGVLRRKERFASIFER